VLDSSWPGSQRIETIPADVAILKHGAMHTSCFQSEGAKPCRCARTGAEPDSDVRTHGNKHIAFGVADVDAFAQSCDAAVPMWCG